MCKSINLIKKYNFNCSSNKFDVLYATQRDTCIATASARLRLFIRADGKPPDNFSLRV